NEAVDFAGGGADAGGVKFDGHVASAEGNNPVGELADADFASAADVVCAAFDARRYGDFDEGVDGVRDEAEIARGVLRAEKNFFLGEGLGDDGGDDGAGALARPVGV